MQVANSQRSSLHLERIASTLAGGWRGLPNLYLIAMPTCPLNNLEQRELMIASLLSRSNNQLSSGPQRQRQTAAIPQRSLHDDGNNIDLLLAKGHRENKDLNSVYTQNYLNHSVIPILAATTALVRPARRY